MGELVRFNRIGWVVLGLGLAVGISTGAFLIFGVLSAGTGLVASILSNEVEREVLWKRIAAALVVIVLTLLLAMVLSLRTALAPLGH